MVCMDQVKIEQSFSVCESETVIDGKKYCDYGIALSQTTDEGIVTVVKVEGISIVKEEVLLLVGRLQDEDIDPVTLHYIVEDYMTEISTL